MISLLQFCSFWIRLLNLDLLEPQLAHAFPQLFLPTALFHFVDEVNRSHSLKERDKIIRNFFYQYFYLYILGLTRMRHSFPSPPGPMAPVLSSNPGISDPSESESVVDSPSEIVGCLFSTLSILFGIATILLCTKSSYTSCQLIKKVGQKCFNCRLLI